MKYRGDIGKIRKALHATNLRAIWPRVQQEGVEPTSIPLADFVTIFNDRRKDGSRRLKIWNAGILRNADADTKAKFMQELCNQFGDRMQAVYLHDTISWGGDFRSFVLEVSGEK